MSSITFAPPPKPSMYASVAEHRAYKAASQGLTTGSVQRGSSTPTLVDVSAQSFSVPAFSTASEMAAEKGTSPESGTFEHFPTPHFKGDYKPTNTGKTGGGGLGKMSAIIMKCLQRLAKLGKREKKPSNSRASAYANPSKKPPKQKISAYKQLGKRCRRFWLGDEPVAVPEASRWERPKQEIVPAEQHWSV